MNQERIAPLEIDPNDFKKMGYLLIDGIALFLQNIRQKKVTVAAPAAELRQLVEQKDFPRSGRDPNEILQEAMELLFNYSLLNGHPKFFGYITSSAAPLGALADLLAAAVNPNVGAQVLSPMATQIERQAIRWITQFVGLPACFDGLLVSGGNVANLTGFFAGLRVKIPSIGKEGLTAHDHKKAIYCCENVHTWIDKAAALSGIGANAVRKIPADQHHRINTALLAATIKTDRRNGLTPIMVIATAGDVSTGAIDNLKDIAVISKAYDCWFHLDGAYGLPCAALPELQTLFEGMADADSIALDPHKWLYAPLEAGCALVKNANHLIETYSSHPVYYNFGEAEPETRNYYEYGLQNSRGFRALKVWMILQQAGSHGYIDMIRTDIALARMLYDRCVAHPELQAISNNLSITTFRYFIAGSTETALNSINEALLNALQCSGEVFVSNAVLNGQYCLRACIVNFRTTAKDIEETVEIVVRHGRAITAKTM